jgi:hypothetical protein
MSYYLYRCDSDTFHSLRPVAPSSHDDFLRFDGTPLKRSYRPLHVKVEPAKRRGSFYSLAGHIPVCDEQALNALKPLIEADLEILPLIVEPAWKYPLFALHVLRVLDCLDPSRAEIVDLGHGMISVRRYAFLDNAIGSTSIFRIRKLELSYCYVTERFRAAVEANQLKGLLLKPL